MALMMLEFQDCIEIDENSIAKLYSNNICTVGQLVRSSLPAGAMISSYIMSGKVVLDDISSTEYNTSGYHTGYEDDTSYFRTWWVVSSGYANLYWELVQNDEVVETNHVKMSDDTTCSIYPHLYITVNYTVPTSGTVSNNSAITVANPALGSATISMASTVSSLMSSVLSTIPAGCTVTRYYYKIGTNTQVISDDMGTLNATDSIALWVTQQMTSNIDGFSIYKIESKLKVGSVYGQQILITSRSEMSDESQYSAGEVTVALYLYADYAASTNTLNGVVKIDGVLKTIVGAWTKIDGVLKPITLGNVKIDGALKKI